jgi:hypothetical protein
VSCLKLNARLVHYPEMIGIYSDERIKHINILCDIYMDVAISVACSEHVGLKGTISEQLTEFRGQDSRQLCRLLFLEKVSTEGSDPRTGAWLCRHSRCTEVKSLIPYGSAHADGTRPK